MKNSMERLRTSARNGAALLAIGALLAGCIDSDTPLVVDTQGGDLFDRYVALGNSITAGFQSGGIHVEFQENAYPALLAERADASFGIPELAMPGCPPPYVAPLSTERTSNVACALREADAPRIVQNLAVPGANTAHVLHPLGTGTTLNTLILGGRTQVAAMLDADPTLVSVWIGNNDALGAALSGDPAELTPLAQFQGAYDQIVGAIQESGAHDAVLIGVANAMALAPALQPGAYFWAIDNSENPYAAILTVDNNCAPGTEGGERLVSFAGLSAQLEANPESPAVINCAAQAPFVLTAEEMQTIGMRVAQFNAHIATRAEENGWIYIDPAADLVEEALTQPDLIRKCQGLATATNPQEFMVAVQNTCPGPTAPNFFGSYFSFDGIHPSTAGHIAITDVIARALNQKHGLALPTNEPTTDV